MVQIFSALFASWFPSLSTPPLPPGYAELSDKTKAFLDNQQIKVDETTRQLLADEQTFVDALHQWLDASFPTMETLRQLANSGKNCFTVASSYYDQRFDQMNYCVINDNDMVFNARNAYIDLKGYSFRVVPGNSARAFDMNKRSVSYDYIYDYLSKKDIPTMGFPSRHIVDLANGLYYRW